MSGTVECCGVCAEVCASPNALHECDCEMCTCGHCIHKHEKWRWHRICSVCTPRAYAQEIPNEIDKRPLDLSEEDEERTVPDWAAELNKHRPAH